MLLESIAKAIRMGAESVEIEYKDRANWIMAVSGHFGVSIGEVKSTQAKELLYEELQALKISKRAIIDGVEHRFAFSERDSFGETLYEIHIDPPQRSSGQKKRSGARRTGAPKR